MSVRRIASVDDARALLLEIGAPMRLVTHGLLVAEAAEALLFAVRAHAVEVDDALVRAGAMLHDAGKTLHPSELVAGGAEHEEAGEALLLDRSVDPAVARCCVSHARWKAMPCSLEELLVALADALWKGVRRPDLEERVIAAVAERANLDAWSLFVDLDSTFERIADEGPERLRRSVT
jgi:putative nucleotidyltransferase with HDIG domain